MLSEVGGRFAPMVVILVEIPISQIRPFYRRPRGAFLSGRVEALKATIAPGAAPVKSEAAIRVIEPSLNEPVAGRPVGLDNRQRSHGTRSPRGC